MIKKLKLYVNKALVQGQEKWDSLRMHALNKSFWKTVPTVYVFLSKARHKVQTKVENSNSNFNLSDMIALLDDHAKD